MKIVGMVFLFSTVCIAQTGYSFLTQSRHATALASSNAFLSTDAVGIQEFVPSMLQEQEGMTLMASQFLWLSDISSYSIGVASSYKLLSFGFYAMNYEISDIELRQSPSSEAISTFDNNYAVFGLSLSYPVTKKIYLGYGHKWTQEKNYIYSANGFAHDLSLSFVSNEFDLFISANNLWQTNARLKNKESAMPQMMNIGARYTVNALTFGTEWHQIEDLNNEVAIFAGHELNDWFSLNVGYHLGDDIRSFSTGFTLDYYGLKFSYGYAVHRYLDSYSSIQIAVTL
jgi:hypothetical protein